MRQNFESKPFNVGVIDRLVAVSVQFLFPDKLVSKGKIVAARESELGKWIKSREHAMHHRQSDTFYGWIFLQVIEDMEMCDNIEIAMSIKERQRTCCSSSLVLDVPTTVQLR